MTKPAQEYFNLRQASQYLGIGIATAKREWVKWQEYGVIASRYPARTLRFKRSDLDKLMQSFKVSR